MQNCRLLYFLHTNTMALHHGLWLGWIVPNSNISFMWAWTSSIIGGGILWNLSLKGSSSITLISCFARSVQPNPPGSKEKMSWYSTSRAYAVAQFLADHSSSPDKSRCCKSSSFLCPVDILAHWTPCIPCSFSNVPSATSTWGTAFTATTWVTLMPLAMAIRAVVQFFTTIYSICSFLPFYGEICLMRSQQVGYSWPV